jgi:copper(I)-binding protein
MPRHSPTSSRTTCRSSPTTRELPLAVKARGGHRTGGLIAVVGVALLIGVLLGHNGKSGPSAVAGTASGKVGDLVLTDVYAPAQTTPSEASVYLTVTNSGAADQLASASSNRAPTVQVMKESAVGGGASSMTQEPTLVVPAHQTVSLVTGKGHLMLLNPPALLKKGQTVTVTLHFARNGTVVLAVPVTGIGGPGT